jgi:membrane fusion protein (multidrug efflux system)
VVLPVEQFGQIKMGMSATVVPQAPLNGQYTAIVTVVDRVVDAASGTFRVRLKLPNKDHVLPAGLRCTVEFTIEEEQVIK